MQFMFILFIAEVDSLYKYKCMKTYRCTIWKRQRDGKYAGICCNYGGEFADAGEKLLSSYSDEAALDRLLSLGFLSRLGSSVEECVSYSRDRGELKKAFLGYTLSQAKTVVSELSPTFRYCWIDGAWRWGLEADSPLLETCVGRVRR